MMKTLAAIFAVLVLLWIWTPIFDDTAPSVRLISPQHDGHLWLCHPDGAWQPVHHPDCPCRTTIQ